jgi:hypothetical protein
MDTAPSQDAGTPTASNVVSLWQTNSRALLAERSFSVKAVRPSAYFHFTGVAIGEEAGSPAGEGSQLDEHFGFPVRDAVEAVNDCFKDRLFSILAG